ncbi:MAG: hypothetical protein KatS3mg030_210 [Saprospiraceae bacterium]|nr:MAG: hypothetical protein KatS3mg030_210 [Saprospiraceae bacterium]
METVASFLLITLKIVLTLAWRQSWLQNDHEM